MEYREEDFLMVSGIQHYEFCKRQWALIHIENQWDENYSTAKGKIVHLKAHDSSISERRGNKIITRGMRIFSSKIGIHGECDVVEFYRSKDGISIHGEEGNFIPFPVEYKKGKPKEHRADILQLCAQAICLEEMLCCEIEEGALYYDEIKKRQIVKFTQELKDEVVIRFREMHELYNRNKTPMAKKTQKCNACSLADICLPKLSRVDTVEEYILNSMKELV